MMNCVLPHSPIPDPTPVRPHTNEKAGRVTRLSCCGDLRSHRLRVNLNSMHGQLAKKRMEKKRAEVRARAEKR
jgi:hypothetical protein